MVLKKPFHYRKVSITGCSSYCIIILGAWIYTRVLKKPFYNFNVSIEGCLSYSIVIVNTRINATVLKKPFHYRKVSITGCCIVFVGTWVQRTELKVCQILF